MVQSSDIKVSLTPSEFFHAAQAGVMRQIKAIGKNWKHTNGFTGSGWDIHIEGACSELVVAKYLGMYWNPNIGRLGLPDVGDIEVRCTNRMEGSLILRQKDSDTARFILVTGSAPTFYLRGWITGQDGKRPEYWRQPNGRPGAWFLPQNFLQPMKTLTTF